jgi:transposase InsO family protein
MSEHDQPIAPNVLARQFAAERPNQRWVGDTTEFVIGSSAKLYLAAILDLYSRFIVGWAVSSTLGQISLSKRSASSLSTVFSFGKASVEE